jgi:hypothetical protein
MTVWVHPTNNKFHFREVAIRLSYQMRHIAGIRKHAKRSAAIQVITLQRDHPAGFGNTLHELKTTRLRLSNSPYCRRQAKRQIANFPGLIDIAKRGLRTSSEPEVHFAGTTLSSTQCYIRHYSPPLYNSVLN